ncbi:MAG: hypothetical protein WBO04_01945 [Steroidobacteraceae bacterium]
MNQRPSSAYANPYVAGIGLGLVLLAAFVLVGRGLGASGAFSSTLSWLANLVAPAHAQGNEYMQQYLGDGSTHPLKAWLVFEVAGVIAGALLNVGSWAFMLMVFVGGYAVAWFMRWQWR